MTGSSATAVAGAPGGGGRGGEKGKGGGKGRSSGASSQAALARKARLGMGKGQAAIVRQVERAASGQKDPFARDIRDDPMADL